MTHEFWATEYHATKTADVGGRIIGRGLVTGFDPIGAIGAHRGFNQTLDDADLSPEERAKAEADTGVGDGAISGLYGIGGSLAGGIAGLAGGGLAGAGIGAGLGALSGKPGGAGRGALIGGGLGGYLGGAAGAGLGDYMASRHSGRLAAEQAISRV